MTRPARAVIQLSAFQHNLNRVKSAAPKSRVMAVVKADAYGHGMVRSARALRGADAFAVARIDEAVALREAGVCERLVVLGGFASFAELALMRREGLETVVHHITQVELLERAPPGDPLRLWLKIDTGMHRLGFPATLARGVYQRLEQCRAVAPGIALLTHLANADDLSDPFTAQQLDLFKRAVGALPGERSTANSAAILGWPATHADWVRPGLMLYGSSPFPHRSAGALGLRPVMTLRSELMAVHVHPRGARIGYGGTWECPEEMPIGVVAIGYGDGYPRHAPSGIPVLVNGHRVALVGRVSMDMITVDLRSQPRARVGDPVVLWGEGLPVEEVAAACGTIPYELLCRVANRVKYDVVAANH